MNLLSPVLYETATSIDLVYSYYKILGSFASDLSKTLFELDF